MVSVTRTGKHSGGSLSAEANRVRARLAAVRAAEWMKGYRVAMVKRVRVPDARWAAWLEAGRGGQFAPMDDQGVQDE